MFLFEFTGKLAPFVIVQMIRVRNLSLILLNVQIDAKTIRNAAYLRLTLSQENVKYGKLALQRRTGGLICIKWKEYVMYRLKTFGVITILQILHLRSNQAKGKNPCQVM